MNPSRVAIGLATFIFVSVPLLGLAQLSYDIRYLDFTGIFTKADSEFPFLSSLLWIFGPLDWWSFITPLAFAVAAAASLRTPLRPSTLALILGSSILQALALTAATKPYFKLTAVMGYPEPAPYPGVPLVANLTLVGTAVGLALYSVSRFLTHSRAHSQKEAEQAADPNGP
jgi:hypothetical protein